MRNFSAALCAAALFITASSAVLADENPTYSGPQSGAETTFVRAIQADLNKRFATAADAQRAGYVRYTFEDDTGAISYANMQWQSSDARHPSQLWYDVNGNLLGADFSVLKSGNDRPHLWGINPGRWYEFDGHVHWVTKDATTGKLTYDLWMPNAKFAAGGGDPAHPTAAELAKMGKVKSASDVVTVFQFPSVWDLIVWVKPNPNGAFAEKNPLVKATGQKAM
ncbi:MAG: hypothetical protein JO043_09310 [Candidatus Eremiobacteraeota bacterium]|nr:hypothetical protein [Candidatus Eremiobacteraeota bacterium]